MRLWERGWALWPPATKLMGNADRREAQYCEFKGGQGQAAAPTDSQIPTPESGERGHAKMGLERDLSFVDHNNYSMHL